MAQQVNRSGPRRRPGRAAAMRVDLSAPPRTIKQKHDGKRAGLAARPETRKSRPRAQRRHGCLAALPEASAAPAPAVNTGDDLGVAGRAARQTRRRLLIEIASQALAAGRVMLAHAGCRTPSRALCYLRRAIINRTPLIKGRDEPRRCHWSQYSTA